MYYCCALLLLRAVGSGANTLIPKPVCDSSKTVSVRHSSTSERIYIESADGSRGGCFSPTEVYESLGPDSPLHPLETPGEWMLDEDLHILDGVVLNVYGTAIGGDCDHLKLRSDSASFVHIRAHGGSLDLMSTRVTSWDSAAYDVDSNYEDGRAYISAISEVVVDATETCQGVAKNEMGEARLDIENCEIAHLGYEASEAWGITWKLRGLCNDVSNLGAYEGIGVYGDIRGSDIHHLYYGHYSFRAIGSLITGNKFHDSIEYCCDPHHASSNLTISHNEMFSCGNHGLILSKYCRNANIASNHIHDNAGVGIFPHFISDDSQISHNIVENNGDSGIAFLESSGGVVYNNTVRNNSNGGVRFSVGSRDNVVIGNRFEDNAGFDLYTYAGSDAVVEAESGNPTDNVFFGNTFSGNAGGARLDDSVDTQFSQNWIGGWDGVELKNSDNVLILGNVFPDSMNYVSSGSCLNSASDVSFADACDNAPIAQAFDKEDLERIVGDGGGGAEPVAVAVATEATADGGVVPIIFEAAVTGRPSASPSASPSVSPTPTHGVIPVEAFDDDLADAANGSDTGGRVAVWIVFVGLAAMLVFCF